VPVPGKGGDHRAGTSSLLFRTIRIYLSAVQQAEHDRLSAGQRIRCELIAGRNGDAAENLKLVA
jgi:hypothetical protein